jgi:aspartate/methionine/tyrosine aminotransferase
MFENILAERMTRLHTESAFQILAEANALEAQGRSVIHCEIGQPDFATPEHIIKAAYEAMKAGYTGYSPAPGYPDVRAALAAVTGSQEEVIRMREAFRERRDWVVPALNEIPGITCRTPGGAFYAFPNIESFGIDSHTFCTRLLREAGVAAAWGTSFGSYGEGHFRLSFANSLENLKIAVDRIASFAAQLC